MTSRATQKIEDSYNRFLPFPQFHASAKQTHIDFLNIFQSEIKGILANNMFLNILGGFDEGNRHMTFFCDVCGDQTVAVRPVTIILWDRTEIHANLCLDCSEKVGKSRKVRVSALMKWLIRSMK